MTLCNGAPVNAPFFPHRYFRIALVLVERPLLLAQRGYETGDMHPLPKMHVFSTPPNPAERAFQAALLLWYPFLCPKFRANLTFHHLRTHPSNKAGYFATQGRNISGRQGVHVYMAYGIKIALYIYMYMYNPWLQGQGFRGSQR